MLFSHKGSFLCNQNWCSIANSWPALGRPGRFGGLNYYTGAAVVCKFGNGRQQRNLVSNAWNGPLWSVSLYKQEALPAVYYPKLGWLPAVVWGSLSKRLLATHRLLTSPKHTWPIMPAQPDTERQTECLKAWKASWFWVSAAWIDYQKACSNIYCMCEPTCLRCDQISWSWASWADLRTSSAHNLKHRLGKWASAWWKYPWAWFRA